ncbi:MAG TPA: hypothetical protein VFQ65_16225 [Kofleriaceae bacterium]|nr:hypothetical protein [Kofleriaceae bacterium]
MKRTYAPIIASISLATAGWLTVVLASPASADPDADSDDNAGGGPELRAVSIVHGMTFSLSQHEVVPGTQGPTTMVTHVQAAIPPGPPNNGLVPSGPPQIDLVVRIVAPDMEVAHAAGALTAIGLMRGMPLAQISAAFAQLNWDIQIKSVRGQVDPLSLIDATKANALDQFLISAIIAGDRPGGGCDAAIPFLQQGAFVLGFSPN